MKKFFALFLVFALCFSCSACGKRISGGKITDITCIRLSDNQSVTFQAEPGFLSQLKGPFEKDGACKGEEEHLYHVTLIRNGAIQKIFYLNADNSVCENGVRFISKEKAETPLDIMTWNNIFEINMEEKAGIYGEIESSKNRDLYPTEIVKSPPKKLENAEKTENTEEVITLGEWTYYISDMAVDGKMSTVLWRRGEKGDQRILSVPQPENKKEYHSIYYIEESYEDSKHKRLYFLVKSGFWEEHDIWSFEIETEQMTRLVHFPCSIPIVMQAVDDPSLTLLWTVYAQSIIAINMETGQIEYKYSRNITSAVEEEFRLRNKEENRYVDLYEAGPGVLHLDIMKLNRETGERTRHISYQIDLRAYSIVIVP